MSRFMHFAETSRGPRVASIHDVYSLVSLTFEMRLAEMAAAHQVHQNPAP